MWRYYESTKGWVGSVKMTRNNMPVRCPICRTTHKNIWGHLQSQNDTSIDNNPIHRVGPRLVYGGCVKCKQLIILCDDTLEIPTDNELRKKLTRIFTPL